MRVGKVGKFKKSKKIGWKMEKPEEMEKVERRTEGGHTVSERPPGSRVGRSRVGPGQVLFLRLAPGRASSYAQGSGVAPG